VVLLFLEGRSSKPALFFFVFKEFLMAKRVFGTLAVWVASQSGGYGFIDDQSGTRYFLHRKNLRSGIPLPGAPAIFEVLPPATETARYARAVNVTLNANTPQARETRIQPKVPVSAVTSTKGTEA
jgi:hypothetical protein